MTDTDFILELNLMADKIERLQDTMEGNLQAYNAVHFTKVPDDLWDALTNLEFVVDNLTSCVQQAREEIA